MLNLFKSKIGVLRIMGFFEGLSLILLVFGAMPLKYLWDNPLWVEIIGPIHGALFIGFVAMTIYLGIANDWKVWKRMVPLIVSSFIPGGTFYMDHKILRPLFLKQKKLQ